MTHVVVDVVVVDTSPVFRRGVRAVVEGDGERHRHARVRIVQVTDSISAMEHQSGPCVCLWDAGLDDAEFTLLRRLGGTRPDFRFVVVAREGRPLDLTRALQAGAVGVIDREVTESALVDVILAAADGRPILAAGASGSLWSQAAATARSGAPQLTRRERQVLELMGHGLGNRAIADRLFISENTVKNHVRRVHEKLQVHSRTEAVVRAAREGIVEIA